MFVVLYLDEAELQKFLAGDPCHGFLVHGVGEALAQVLVPREKVSLYRQPLMLGLSRPMASIAGDSSRE